MSTPPPFEPLPDEPRKKGPKIWLWVILGVVVICCGGIAYFANAVRNMFNSGGVGAMTGCLLAYDGIYKGLEDYAKEHDGKLPPAESWQVELKPYYEKYVTAKAEKMENPLFEIAVAKADEPWGCVQGGKLISGMAYNSDVAGKVLADLPNKAETVLVFEIKDPAMNANMAYAAQPYDASPVLKAPNNEADNRGWLELTADGETSLMGKSGKRNEVNADFGGIE